MDLRDVLKPFAPGTKFDEKVPERARVVDKLSALTEQCSTQMCSVSTFALELFSYGCQSRPGTWTYSFGRVPDNPCSWQASAHGENLAILAAPGFVFPSNPMYGTAERTELSRILTANTSALFLSVTIMGPDERRPAAKARDYFRLGSV
jgi:hypothetical protein